MRGRSLAPGEEVAADLRPHWWALAGPVATVVVLVAAGIAALSEGWPVTAGLALVAVLLGALLWLLARYLRWVTTSLVVTSERLILRRGVLSRSGREIPLEQLTDIGYRQRLVERVVGAGDLVFESAGRDGREVWPTVSRPAAVQALIYRQLHLARAGGAGGRPLSVPEQIEQLADLRRRGVISEAEFRTKKNQLLERM